MFFSFSRKYCIDTSDIWPTRRPYLCSVMHGVLLFCFWCWRAEGNVVFPFRVLHANALTTRVRHFPRHVYQDSTVGGFHRETKTRQACKVRSSSFNAGCRSVYIRTEYINSYNFVKVPLAPSATAPCLCFYEPWNPDTRRSVIAHLGVAWQALSFNFPCPAMRSLDSPCKDAP